MTDNQKYILEGQYSYAIKKAYKLPKFTNPEKMRKFFGFQTLQQWADYQEQRVDLKIEEKKSIKSQERTKDTTTYIENNSTKKTN